MLNLFSNFNDYRTCYSCGHLNQDNYNFCSHCGVEKDFEAAPRDPLGFTEIVEIHEKANLEPFYTAMMQWVDDAVYCEFPTPAILSQLCEEYLSVVESQCMIRRWAMNEPEAQDTVSWKEIAAARGASISNTKSTCDKAMRIILEPMVEYRFRSKKTTITL